VVDDADTNRSRQLLFDGLIVACLFAVGVSWFTTALLKPRPTLLLAGATIAALAVSRRGTIVTWRLPALTLTVCAFGLLLRAPALVEPAGFVGADGSLQAILVNVILSGTRPAPGFLETSNYQGSLKAHLGALASVFVGREDLGRLVVMGSVALWTVFTAAVISLGRRLGGGIPAAVAGLFVALSPRFATIFSVSNVGEYPDALALGTWAMAWAAALVAGDRGGIAARAEFFGIGALIGVALWQQPIAISFGFAALGLLGLRALVRRDPWFLAVLPGLALGRLPVTIHNVQTAGSSNEVLGSFLRSAGQSMPFGEHVRGTLEWAFPIVFAGLSNDSGLDEGGRFAIGLACAGIVVFFLGRSVAELRTAIRERSWMVVRSMAAAQFVAALMMVWLVSGGGQYGRPRYFLPLLAGFALALGDVAGALWRRSRVAAVALAATVIGANGLSNLERMKSGLRDGRDLRVLALRIEALGLKSGYADVAIAGPLIMLTGERVSVDGVLQSAVGERLPARHVDRVRLHGPDFYLADAEAAPRLAARLEALGVTCKVEGASPRLFYGLSRRVPLTEVQD
jgi:hypothetical protein